MTKNTIKISLISSYSIFYFGTTLFPQDYAKCVTCFESLRHDLTNKLNNNTAVVLRQHQPNDCPEMVSSWRHLKAFQLQHIEKTESWPKYQNDFSLHFVEFLRQHLSKKYFLSVHILNVWLQKHSTMNWNTFKILA